MGTETLENKLKGLVIETDLIDPQPRQWVDDPDEWKLLDRAYRQGMTWQQKRMAVFARDQWLCQSCKLAFAEVVHHKSYRNWKAEPAEDLVSLCRNCHDYLHKNKRG